MNKRFIALALVGLSACGGGGTPSSPTPTIAQIAGVWRFTQRATAISNSECVGQALNAAGATGVSAAGTAQITQNGASVSVTVNDSTTGASSRYTGTVGASALALNWQSCDLCALRNLQCAPGVFRDITPQADTISATVTGSSMSGTEAETYNVTVSANGAPAGTLTINSTFSGTKQ